MRNIQRTLLTLAAVGATGLLAGCWEKPPITSTQQGFRGTGMVEVDNPRIVVKTVAANQAPEALPAAPAGSPPASSVYKNVPVLGHLGVAEFTRLMVAMTAWVSPEQGCNYCHEGANFESDALYTKQVARKMLSMTMQVNAGWKDHVGATGVTCYTCHRGQPVPANVWFKDVGPKDGKAYAGWRNGQNAPAKTVGLTSLPADPFTPYFGPYKGEVRVIGTKALPNEHVASIQATEWNYALMVHLSEGLGVNCTYCHNSRSFAEWNQSSPARVKAWHGIRMVRDINVTHLDPLAPVFPAAKLGPKGDTAKANCATCHNGVNKPLYGVSMLKDHPELAAPPPPAPPAPTGLLAKILFAVGGKGLDANGGKAVTDVAKAMKDNPAIKVAVSGFADQTGNKDKNLELAKQRAFAVRDALKAAGVEEARIVLQKPEFVVGGTADDARRVDLSVM